MPLVAGNDCSQVYTVSTLEKSQKEQNEEVLGILDAFNFPLHTQKPGMLQLWGCRVVGLQLNDRTTTTLNVLSVLLGKITAQLLSSLRSISS